MRDELLDYYERELTFLRQMGAEFAEKYPKIAARLQIEQDRCEDPHVERMIEAFAFLAGRVHLKIDDEFPEITEALLGILYPHYVGPSRPCRSWNSTWTRSRASSPPGSRCRAGRCCTRGRWKECPAGSGPATKPRCGR